MVLIQILAIRIPPITCLIIISAHATSTLHCTYLTNELNLLATVQELKKNMKISIAFASLVVLLSKGILFTNAQDRFSEIGDLIDMLWEKLECPDPVEYANATDIPLTCVANSIPPWPICLFHNITYFIASSVSSASRCCDPDRMDECRCPVKSHPQFVATMEDWCENIQTCPKDIAVLSELETDTWAKYMLIGDAGDIMMGGDPEEVNPDMMDPEMMDPEMMDPEMVGPDSTDEDCYCVDENTCICDESVSDSDSDSEEDEYYNDYWG